MCWGCFAANIYIYNQQLKCDIYKTTDKTNNHYYKDIFSIILIHKEACK